MEQTQDIKLCNAGQKLKLSVSNGEVKTLNFLKQQHCMHKQKDPNTWTDIKKNPKDLEKVNPTEEH